MVLSLWEKIQWRSKVQLLRTKEEQHQRTEKKALGETHLTIYQVFV